MYGTVVESTGLVNGVKTTVNTFDFEYFMKDVTDIEASPGVSSGLFLV